MQSSRRTFVKSGAGLVALSMLAGCAEDVGNENGNGNGDDSAPEPGPEPEPETAVVSILAENLGGDHDHDHDDEHHDDDHDHDDDLNHDDDHDHDDKHHDDEHHDDEHHDDDELVSQAVIEEACGHMEFDEPESLVGGASADEASVIDATHQPFDVSIEGDSAFVTFDADAYGGHDHDDHHDDEHGGGSAFGLFTHGGSITVHTGHTRHEEHGVEGCADIEKYVVVEPDHGSITVELTPDE